MLTIIIPGQELYNEDRNEFVVLDRYVLEMEHSLVSLSKWESIYEKPFLGPQEKTSEEVLGYIKAMILNPKIPPEVISLISSENRDRISEYIDSKQSATWFRDDLKPPRNREIVTSELIYYWMFTAGIPIECENWHLNRLFTLIRVFNVKNSKPTKMSRGEIAARNRALNAERRTQLGTQG